MSICFSVGARRFGIASASTVAVLQVAYAGVLAAGLLSLTSPDLPIPDPYFTAMEVLILLLVPALVALMVALHAWADKDAKVFSLTALVFMAIVAGLTAGVHFSVLVLSRHPAFSDQALLLSFTWPSVVYAIDILAWDVFFALAVLFAAPVVRGSRLADWTRYLLITSGILSFAGLAGVAAGDMQVRNIGIVGYAVVFPVASGLLAILFRVSPAQSSED